MDVFLTDKEIKDLIKEQKQMTVASEVLFRSMRDKRGHKESEHTIPRADGSSFVIKIRLSNENPLDFSAILGYNPPKLTKIFLLRRYNGKSHEHKNKLEKENVFYDFHIHTATERYQREGTKEEYFVQGFGGMSGSPCYFINKDIFTKKKTYTPFSNNGTITIYSYFIGIFSSSMDKINIGKLWKSTYLKPLFDKLE